MEHEEAGMLGLAIMAARLAYLREHGVEPIAFDAPLADRKTAFQSNWHRTATREYYLIIDRITRGEEP